MVAGKPMLALRGVCKRFGGVLANDDVSFEIAPAALVGLIGPNGSGKTTLLNCIGGQLVADAGEIDFEQRRLNGCAPAQIARMGLIRTFQDAGVYDGMTALQNIRSSASHAGEGIAQLWQRGDRSTAERAWHWLSFVGLAEQADQLAGELSYGQRKLLEFAMALMTDPKMLLLDEPTAGVSPVMVPELVDCLRRVNQELALTILFVEHNMPVVFELARQVHCMSRGRLLASGTPAQIRADDRVIEAYLGAA